MLINKLNLRDAGIYYQPDDVPAAPAVPPTTPPTVLPVEPPSQEDDEAYDKPRALATIANLRKFEIEAKRLQRELDAAKKVEDDRKTAEMSEAQKAAKRAQEAEDAYKALEAKHRTSAINSAIRVAAMAAGFADADDAVKLADLSTVQVSDDDVVIGATEAVKELASAKPHLLVATKLAAPNINATASGTLRSLTVEDLKQQRRDTDTIYQPF